jgi:hypothetical protein
MRLPATRPPAPSPYRRAFPRTPAPSPPTRISPRRRRPGARGRFPRTPTPCPAHHPWKSRPWLTEPLRALTGHRQACKKRDPFCRVPPWPLPPPRPCAILSPCATCCAGPSAASMRPSSSMAMARRPRWTRRRSSFWKPCTCRLTNWSPFWTPGFWRTSVSASSTSSTPAFPPASQPPTCSTRPMWAPSPSMWTSGSSCRAPS